MSIAQVIGQKHWIWQFGEEAWEALMEALQVSESSPGGMQIIERWRLLGITDDVGKREWCWEQELGLGVSPALKSELVTGRVWAGVSWSSCRRGQSRGGCSPSVLGTPNSGILFCVSGAEHPLFAPTLVTDKLLSWALFPLREHRPRESSCAGLACHWIILCSLF